MPATAERVSGYARGLLAVARAEGDQPAVEQDLAMVAETLRNSIKLRETLADAHIDLERRLAIVEELLSGSARPATAALVSMIVAAGRAAEMIEIIDETLEQAAAGRGKRIARVRSAVSLTQDQQARLAAAVKAASGIDVEIQAVVDASVIGGVVTEIGDDVIDGSVRSRLRQMRSGLR